MRFRRRLWLALCWSGTPFGLAPKGLRLRVQGLRRHPRGNSLDGSGSIGAHHADGVVGLGDVAGLLVLPWGSAGSAKSPLRCVRFAPAHQGYAAQRSPSHVAARCGAREISPAQFWGPSFAWRWRDWLRAWVPRSLFSTTCWWGGRPPKGSATTALSPTNRPDCFRFEIRRCGDRDERQRKRPTNWLSALPARAVPGYLPPANYGGCGACSDGIASKVSTNSPSMIVLAALRRRSPRPCLYSSSCRRAFSNFSLGDRKQAFKLLVRPVPLIESIRGINLVVHGERRFFELAIGIASYFIHLGIEIALGLSLKLFSFGLHFGRLAFDRFDFACERSIGNLARFPEFLDYRQRQASLASRLEDLLSLYG